MAKTPIICFAAALLCVALAGLEKAAASDANPLRPPDMSSPRATLEAFVTNMDNAYATAAELIGGYSASDRLYLNAKERRRLIDVRNRALPALQALDTARIFSVVRDVLAGQRAIQLKEVLDRIGLPPLDTVPDRDAMAKSAAKRWRMPDTEIDFVQVETGPHAGDYVVSADTVDRLPEFYERIKHLPYLPGAGKNLSDVYRTVSGNETATIYEITSNSPVGLDRLIPTRWMVSLPSWAKARLAELAVWQWFGLAFGLLIALLFMLAAYRVARYITRRREDRPGPGWQALLTPAAITVVAYFFVPVLCLALRIGGTPRVAVAVIQTIAVFAAAAWVSVVGSGLLAEAIVRSERLTRHSLDGQLVRLGTRFFGIVIAVGLLMEGATELGFPAYSVLAGLGVGGLAVALAARDSLANFLGSVLIMFEKPFRVGHLIRVSGSEGVVEEVGFRSTRIRTADNSLISIPNNAVVNATVENLSARTMRRQRLLLQLAYDTPREKMEAFSAEIKKLLDEHPLIDKENFHVRLNDLDFGDSSFNILVIFYILVSSYAEELQEREKFLYDVIALAQKAGAEFAFPTRTVFIENSPPAPAVGSIAACQ